MYAPISYLNGDDNGVEGAVLDANVRLGLFQPASRFIDHPVAVEVAAEQRRGNVERSRDFAQEPSGRVTALALAPCMQLTNGNN